MSEPKIKNMFYCSTTRIEALEAAIADMFADEKFQPLVEASQNWPHSEVLYVDDNGKPYRMRFDNYGNLVS